MKYGFNKEKADAIVEFLENSPLRTHAAKHVGIGFETFEKWEKENQEFQDRVKKAEIRGWKGIHDHCASFIITTKNWVAQAWMLERRFSEIYALRTKSEISGYLEGSENESEIKKRRQRVASFLRDISETHGIRPAKSKEQKDAEARIYKEGTANLPQDQIQTT